MTSDELAEAFVPGHKSRSHMTLGLFFLGVLMNYDKPFRTFDDLVKCLENDHGLLISGGDKSDDAETRP